MRYANDLIPYNYTFTHAFALSFPERRQLKTHHKRRNHRWWVHDIIRNRLQQGAYHNLFKELKFDEEKFHQYFRLTREQFAQVLSYVEEDLSKHCRSREVICPVICPRQRLAICLR